MKKKFKAYMIVGVSLLAVVAIIVGILSFRFDYVSGSHRIIPTAMDNDFWGNYKVYFKTNEYTKNLEEDYYYIEKGNKELVEQMDECIRKSQEVTVYYDKYIGFKGIGAPESSPIIRIEKLITE